MATSRPALGKQGQRHSDSAARLGADGDEAEKRACAWTWGGAAGGERQALCCCMCLPVLHSSLFIFHHNHINAIELN